MQDLSSAKAKIFMHGRSQAVRLPKEFRFEGSEVFVRRMGEDVVLSLRERPPMASLVEALDMFESGFQLERAQADAPDVRDPIAPPSRRR